MTPPNQTVIFTGFRRDLDFTAIAQFVRGGLGASLSAELETRNSVSVTGGKVYINFKSGPAALQATEAFSKISAKEICNSNQKLEIWVKDQGRSNAKYSVLNMVEAANTQSEMLGIKSASEPVEGPISNYECDEAE